MNRPLSLAALVVLAVTSCASATLSLRATAPTDLAAGTCAKPLAAWPATAQMWVHVAWYGPSIGRDSARAWPGQAVAFSRTVPAGVYTVRAWASNAAGAGCETTVTETLAVPGKVRVQ